MFQRKLIQIMSHGVNMRTERLKFTEFAGDLFTPRLAVNVISPYFLLLFIDSKICILMHFRIEHH